jgi:predicted HAD superfamily phosphohydrolase
MSKVAFFDLEGPISAQDNAYEVFGLVPNGHEIFEVISKYDDIGRTTRPGTHFHSSLRSLSRTVSGRRRYSTFPRRLFF